jgi:GntR family transcriptional regulator, transcriptional repressor for pyruvate dehydrogenase complex
MSPRLVPLERGGLVQGAVEQLRAFVLSRRGDAELPSEAELGGRLGVSRTVLREALKHLQAQGLVVLAQGRRARVRPADPQATIESLDVLLRRSEGSLLHLVEVRRPLEAEIVEVAARRGDPESLEEAGRAIAEMASTSSLDAQIEADLKFHRALAKATGNPVFVLLLDTLAGLLRASRQKTLGKHGSRIAVEHHREILDAVRRRDPGRARAAMLGHLGLNERHLRGDGA